MSHALRLRPPAKINLALRVLGRRADGYHELETVFHAIDLCDELWAARRDEPGVELSIVDAAGRGLPVVAGADNLVVRAAQAVLGRSAPQSGLRFHLVKRIPAGGGLGGGSSDAAAALRLAAQLVGARLDAAELDALAVGLGADVPFFLRGGTCLGRGIGELLWPVPDPTPLELVLILPSFGTPTGAVFDLLGAGLIADADADTLGRIEPPTATEIALAMQQGNGLEAAAMECVPALRALRARIGALGFSDVRMSGSGSTLFVARRSAAAADAALATLERGLVGSDAELPASPPAVLPELLPGQLPELLRASSAGPAAAPEPCAWPGTQDLRDPGEG